MHDIDYSGAGGLRLAADAQGSVQNPPVVFVPGAGQTRNAWRRAAAIVAAQGYRAISLDLRGHGESAWSTDGDHFVPQMPGEGLDRIRAFMSAGAKGFAAVDEASAAIQKYLPNRRNAGTSAGLVSHLLGLIPQATWTQVPDAAHMVVGDQNDAFNEALSDFINGLATAAATAP